MITSKPDFTVRRSGARFYAYEGKTRLAWVDLKTHQALGATRAWKYLFEIGATYGSPFARNILRAGNWK